MAVVWLKNEFEGHLELGFSDYSDPLVLFFWEF